MNKYRFPRTQQRVDCLKRAAAYYRVSTGRQYANDASIPSQRKITSGFCEQNDYVVVYEFVEAATATDETGVARDDRAGLRTGSSLRRDRLLRLQPVLS